MKLLNLLWCACVCVCVQLTVHIPQNNAAVVEKDVPAADLQIDASMTDVNMQIERRQQQRQQQQQQTKHMGQLAVQNRLQHLSWITRLDQTTYTYPKKSANCCETRPEATATRELPSTACENIVPSRS